MAGFVPVESGLRFAAPEPVVVAGVVTAGRLTLRATASAASDARMIEPVPQLSFTARR